jgi:hypothetical protein
VPLSEPIKNPFGKELRIYQRVVYLPAHSLRENAHGGIIMARAPGHSTELNLEKSVIKIVLDARVGAVTSSGCHRHRQIKKPAEGEPLDRREI